MTNAGGIAAAVCVIGALFAASVGCVSPAGEPTAVNAQVEPLVAQVRTTDTTPTTSLPKITSYYPPERLVEVRIVADSGPAGTLPRSL